MTKTFTQNLPETFIESFRLAAAKYTDMPAVCCEDKILTYAQLDELSDRISAFITQKSYSPETFIGIFQIRSVNYIASILGVMKSGNVYVPIDPDTLNPGNELFPKERLRFMVQDTGTPFILTDEESKKFLDFLPCDTFSAEEIYDKNCDGLNGKHAFTSSTAAYGIYTSGSTGRPKLTVLEYHSMMNLYAGLNKHVFSKVDGMDQQIQVSINAPFGFDASVQQIICLLNGYCLNIVPEKCRRSVTGFIQFIQERAINILDCTPSQMNLLLRHKIFDNCSNLKAVLIGGEAIPPDSWGVLEDIENVALYNVYGPTECCVDTTLALINNGKKCIPHIGKPLEGNTVLLLDENLAPVPEGEEGEIVIAGEGVARGYHNRPELNSQFFLDGVQNLRVYRTGDMGCVMPDGNILFRGRRDGQIKIRSHRIEIMEVAATLKKYPAVMDCVMTVNNSGDYGELIAYIVPKKAGTLTEFTDDLITHIKTLLPTYMLPNRFIEIEKIPLTENGKINYSALPKLTIERNDMKDAESNIEALVGDIVEKVLKTRIGREESFMAVGGDSLRVMMLLAEIYIKFMVDIDYKAFFQSPTIAFLISEIEKSAKIEQR